MEDNERMAGSGTEAQSEKTRRHGKVRAEEEVREAIEKELEDDGAEKTYVFDVLSRLYAEWREGGPVPTRAALVSELHGLNWPEADAVASRIESMDPDPFLMKNRRKLIVGAICVVAVICAVGIAALGLGGESAQPVKQDAPEKAVAAGTVETEEAEVKILIKAEGADEAVVEARAEIVDSDGKPVVEERAFAANEEISAGKLPEGSYELHVVSAPVLEDGSTYRLPDEPTAFTVEGGEDAVKVEAELARIAAEDMTKEQLEAVAGELEASGRADAASTARDRAQTAQSVSGSASSVKHETATPSDGGSNSGVSSSGSGSSAGGSPSGSGGSGSSQQSHTHNWEAQTVQNWVSNNVWVVDQEAWDEQVTNYEWHEVCSCGYDCTANGINPAAHKESHGRGWSGSVSTQQVPVTTTVHHDEVGHWEDQGHYETVTTGYKCSICGVTQ